MTTDDTPIQTSAGFVAVLGAPNAGKSTFISRIDVIGMENIPQHGPAILVANHFNQFIDDMSRGGLIGITHAKINNILVAPPGVEF